MNEGQCSCGASRVRITGPAVARARCHCTICQRFNQAPFADVVVFRTRDVELLDPSTVTFSVYRRPPNVQRGRCASCGKPVLEHARVPLFPDFSMVPAGLLPDDGLPPVAMDMFYESRTEDIDDDRPKYTGYLKSQLAFFRALIRGLRTKASA